MNNQHLSFIAKIIIVESQVSNFLVHS